MTINEYLMKAVQDDARRAGERDRLLLEARRARRARRQRLVPAAPARRRTEMGKIVVSENVTLDGVIQDPAGDEGTLAAAGTRSADADPLRLPVRQAEVALRRGVFGGWLEALPGELDGELPLAAGGDPGADPRTSSGLWTDCAR
jgi:hypothetical protein